MNTENSESKAPVDRLVIRLPQRFQWKNRMDGPWLNGIVFPVSGRELWQIHAGQGHATFFADPWEAMGMVLGDAAAFRWIDNDYEWEPKGAICCDTFYQSAEDFRVHLLVAHQCG
jgi:hypothetical protein